MHRLQIVLLLFTLLLVTPTDSLTDPVRVDDHTPLPGNHSPLAAPDALTPASVAVAAVQPSPKQPAPKEPSREPSQITPGGTSASPDEPPSELTPVEADVVEWAYSRFAAAGLELPDVTISFSDESEPCKGEQGIYRRHAGVHSITVCVSNRRGAAIDHLRRRTLLHELGHAWDHATLTDADREQLLPLLDSNGWYDLDAAWQDRGVERLAETLQWGLLDQLRRPLRIDTSCAVVHEDFTTITKHAALGPIEPTCALTQTAPTATL